MHDQDDVPFADVFQVWLRVAALSFGGQAGSMIMMHRLVVDEKKWIGEARFLHALEPVAPRFAMAFSGLISTYCTLLPGPEAQQLAIYIGWLMHGTPSCCLT